MAGLCWGADTTDEIKNYKRGLDCLQSRHGRTWEFPDTTLVLEGYSARVIRELYTHIGGAPTRLQESTRYVDGANFEYIIPEKIAKNKDPLALAVYEKTMDDIRRGIKTLESYGVHKEDAAMLLPLGMTTKVVVKMNFRTLAHMAQERLCTRAYYEFRQLIKDIGAALSEISVEWGMLVDDYFIPKCERDGYCVERYCCGRMPKLEDLQNGLNETDQCSRGNGGECSCGGNCTCKKS
jgi:thymidylate synthase (FAD)